MGQPDVAAAQPATLDRVVIDAGVGWWQRQSPRARWAVVGTALMSLAALGMWGVAGVGLPSGARALVTPPTHSSPFALPGELLVALFGVGAYTTLALPLGAGALLLAESLARRRLLRRWLVAPVTALWLLVELEARLVGGPAVGGALGDALAIPLAHAPLLVAQLGALVVAMVATMVIGVSLAHHVASGAVAAPGRAIAAIKHARAARASTAASSHTNASGGSTASGASGASGGSTASAASGASGASARRAVSRNAFAASSSTDGAEGDADTDAADDPAPAGNQHNGQPLVEAWVSAGTRDKQRRQTNQPSPTTPSALPSPRGGRAGGEVMAESLARQAQQALLAQRAVARVYPLRITPTTISLCVRPIERLKRDAAGRLVTDADGAPIIVRTRVSRILALRDELARALGAPTMRLAPLAPEDAPDVEQPALLLEIPRH